MESSDTLEFQFISNLHLDTQKEPIKLEAIAKYLIVAGNVSNFNRDEVSFRAFLSWANDSFEKVLYVPGNREYYGMDFIKADQRLRSIVSDYKNIFLLTRGYYILEGVAFIGATLWYTIPDDEKLIRRKESPDFKYLMIRNKRVIASQINSLYLDDVSALSEIYNSLSKERPVCFITHFPPLPLSPDDKLAPKNDLSKFITYRENRNISAWIYGDSNITETGKIEQCTIVTNPHGFPKSKNEKFKTNLVLSIDKKIINHKN